MQTGGGSAGTHAPCASQVRGVIVSQFCPFASHIWLASPQASVAHGHHVG
jgi:hypothetical protein